jgi:superfamily II DNA helicase RecQ
VTGCQLRLTRICEISQPKSRLWQSTGSLASRTSTSVVSIAPTGSGKTLTFLMPLLFNGGKVTIIVTALNVLSDQFVQEGLAAGFLAIFITADNNNDITFAVSNNFCSHQHVIYTPRRVCKLIR